MPYRFISAVAVAAMTGGAVALTMSTARADTLSYSAVVSLRNAPFNQAVQLTKFDSSIGILTGVSLSLDATINATASVYNPENVTLSFSSISVAIPITVTGPSNLSFSATATAGQTYSPSREVTSGSFISIPGLPATASRTTQVPLSNFAAYQGVGSQVLSLTAAAGQATATGTGDPNLFYGGSGKAGATISVTYTYTAATAPEPSSLPLLAVGVLPLIGALRRRK